MLSLTVEKQADLRPALRPHLLTIQSTLLSWRERGRVWSRCDVAFLANFHFRYIFVPSYDKVPSMAQ